MLDFRVIPQCIEEDHDAIGQAPLPSSPHPPPDGLLTCLQYHRPSWDRWVAGRSFSRMNKYYEMTEWRGPESETR